MVRDGQETVLDPSELVVGDLLIAAPGDQVMLDGTIVTSEADLDESLLTGETDHVRTASATA